MNRLDEMVQSAERESRTIFALVKEKEALSMGKTEEEIVSAMEERYDVMLHVYKAGIVEEMRSVSGLTGGEGHRLMQYEEQHRGGLYPRAAARAMGIANVNASMGRIVAAPTAGSCGILPATLISLAEQHHKRKEEVVNCLFTASLIGEVIAENASLSGAEGGCQAECGSAAAMAAGAGVELCGGTPGQAADASAFALEAVMGLVCDPVAGLVECPCIKRNAFGAVQALLAIDMALAGIKSVIPADEVITAMGEVGRSMPESLRETAKGGIAATPTGKKIAERLTKSSNPHSRLS